uniref:Uncharacterized protein n=1 Tax=Solanum tuberosum TaxID=4113 RepID=M1CP62_SOLTU
MLQPTTPPASSVTATAAAGGEQAVTRPPPISKLRQTSNDVTTKTKHFDRDGYLQICPRQQHQPARKAASSSDRRMLQPTTPSASSVTATAAAGDEQAVTRPPPISKLRQTSNDVTTKTKHFDRDGSLQICPRLKATNLGFVSPYTEAYQKNIVEC